MAIYYFRTVGTAWNNNTSWSTVSSAGASAGVIPLSTDDVIFDAGSAVSCPVTTTVGLCKNITTTGYSGNFILNVDLRVFGNLIIGALTTFSGAAFFTIGGQNPAVAKTMTSNGVLFPNFQLGVGGPPLNTLTFNDVLNVGNIRQALANGIVTNGASVNVNGSMTIENTNVPWSGTTVYNLIGTGTFGQVAVNGFFSNTININTLGTITLLANFRFNGATLNYIAGTVDTTTNLSLLDLYANNSITSKNTSTGNEIIFNNVRAGATGILGTTTLGSDMRIGGNFQVAQINGYNFNGNKIFIGGNVLNPTVTNGGTSVMELFGSTASTISSGTLTRQLIVNKSGGAIVTLLAGNLTFNGTILTLNSPVNFLTNATTVTHQVNLTINNFIGSPYHNMTIASNAVVTLNGSVNTVINNNLTLSGNAVFQGTVGWTCNNLFAQAAAATITLQQAVTYRTIAAVNITGGTNAVRAEMKSSNLVIRAIWTLDPGAAQSLIYVNGTRIDSSGGQTVWSFGVAPANIATSINWNLGSRPGTVAHVFVF